VHDLLAEPWVRHHAVLCNAEVRRLMITHDILAFPTMDESLGWVAIEAGASGMPTIATNVFAIPELVLDGATGWTIDIPLDEDRRWTHIGRADAKEAWMATQAEIGERMTAILAEVAADRSAIGNFGNAARQHINALYGIDRASAQLEKLYSSAMRVGQR
jgi:glycosyltransferase involved in cell wall biosynthesis